MPKTRGLSDLSPERCNAEPAGSRFSGAGAEWPRCLGVPPSSRHPCRHADTAIRPRTSSRCDPDGPTPLTGLPTFWRVSEAGQPRASAAPRMTTGQILTGASPLLAIEYQIVVAIHGGGRFRRTEQVAVARGKSARGRHRQTADESAP